MSRYLRLLIFITLYRFSVGVLIVGPKFIRSNQEYTVAIGNYFTQTIQLMLRMEVKHMNGSVLLPIQSFVRIPTFTNRMLKFEIPTITTPVDVTLNIQGQNGFSYNDAEYLVFLSHAVSALIQINKPVFKPCEKIRFRVIVLDSEMKPPTRFASMNVTMFDAQQNVVGNWPSAQLHIGVFESNLQLAANPILGIWCISVQLEEEELVSKSFEVKEYVLSTIEVQILTNEIPLEEHQALNLTITANFRYGKPAKGVAKIELYFRDDKVHQRNEIFINGTEKLHLRLLKPLELHDDQQDVRVKVTFVEHHTARTTVKEQHVTVYRQPYRVSLPKSSTEFRPGYPFNCIIMLNHHDGSPAKNVDLEVDMSGDEVEHEEKYNTGNDGSIIVPFLPTQSTSEILLIVKQNGIDLFTDHLYKQDTVTDQILRLQRVSPIRLNAEITFKVTCNQQMPFFVYYVISKQKIVQVGFIKSSRKKKSLLRLKTSKQMTPKSTIVVATVLPKTTNEQEKQMIFDSLEIDFMQLSNNLDIIIAQHEFKPGHKINIHLEGRPNAYVGLAAYDKGLTEFTKHHDLFWEDVMQVFDGFHKTDSSEYDAFYSKGIFVKASGGVQVGDMLEISDRSSLDIPAKPKQMSLRTNFLESWLWKNVTLESTGHFELIELLPETITSWYLTGFTVDPLYGLGIIKQQLQINTTKPFYIVDNLPYSIKRGEPVLLQFTLFNSLETEQMVEVTMFSVNNQTKFIESSLKDLSCTKRVNVSRKTGETVSFLVSAQKLGEMVVRVVASIVDRPIESDALEKVILVMPESLIQQRNIKQYFYNDKYNDETFSFDLEIPVSADYESRKIEFKLDASLIVPLNQNLNDLLTITSRCNEEDVMKLVLNFAVLDYLNVMIVGEQSPIDKATDLLRQAYQNLIRCRNKNGSFGSVYLTTFVASGLQNASNQITKIDTALVGKAFDWLASVQNTSGRFDEVGSVILKHIQLKGVALTSYVLATMLNNENAKIKHSNVIDKGMNYINRHLHNITNVYDLSLATYVIMLYGHNQKDHALKKLIEMSTITDGERYWMSPHSVQTTSYALLSFVISGKLFDSLPVMSWLTDQSCDTETFLCYQDIFTQLQALTKLSERLSPMQNDFIIELNGNNLHRKFPINSPRLSKPMSVHLPKDTETMKINVRGFGYGLIEVAYEYGMDLRHFEQHFHLELNKQSTASDDELKLNVCVNVIDQDFEVHSDVILVEVNFPSGYMVDDNPISEQTKINPIKNIEIRYGGTSVVVYYHDVGTETNCFTATAYKRLKVHNQSPAYVIVYDSSDSNLNAIEMYDAGTTGTSEIQECS